MNYNKNQLQKGNNTDKKRISEIENKIEHIMLSEMSDMERQIPHALTHTWNLTKSNS